MNEALKNTRIVLCEPSHAGNIGAAARAMLTMGIDRLALVRPTTGAHQSHEAVRRAARAVSVLERARVCESLDEALAKLEGFKLDGVAQKIQCPFLLTHGTDDEQVSMADAQKLFDWLTPGATFGLAAGVLVVFVAVLVALAVAVLWALRSAPSDNGTVTIEKRE